MSEIVLVTQNDEPALAFGEYEISADGNTLYVGSAGVSDKDTEIIYIGQSPIKITSGVFTRIPPKRGTVSYSTPTLNINANFSRVIKSLSNTENIDYSIMNVSIKEV